MSNISAGIGRGQLEVLDQRVVRKREIFKYYSKNLVEHWDFLPEPEGFYTNRWLTTALRKSSKTNLEELRKRLEEENIESRPLWKPMHLQSLYRPSPLYVNGISEGLFKNGLCLPSGSALELEQMQRIRLLCKCY
jgi:dTDP-4-amino-4,6-dideoxygalactose transaminase